ncbi:uncharacterized protein LOC120351819 [Nilaparvata lugens]|uniref:uncharacterized protein LOC120351819 n=1 Tax=Nilaparvata lugens TaxID=108931 RepID=UPI00193CBADE|nr:uncharacterized protein LOC120351819 [Nilaparvata lugens]
MNDGSKAVDSTIDVSFDLLFYNVQCLQNKVNELELIVSTSRRYKILCLSEHWMCPEELKLLNISNYKLAAFYSRKHCPVWPHALGWSHRCFTSVTHSEEGPEDPLWC